MSDYPREIDLPTRIRWIEEQIRRLRLRRFPDALAGASRQWENFIMRPPTTGALPRAWVTNGSIVAVRARLSTGSGQVNFNVSLAGTLTNIAIGSFFGGGTGYHEVLAEPVPVIEGDFLVPNVVGLYSGANTGELSIGYLVESSGT